MSHSTKERSPDRPGARRSPDAVNEAGRESFPASDPPAHSLPAGDVQKRKRLDESELLDWMSERLHRQPEYRKCRFTAIQLIEAESEEDSNWLSADLDCDSAPDKACMDAADAIIEEARAYFNVA